MSLANLPLHAVPVDVDHQRSGMRDPERQREAWPFPAVLLIGRRGTRRRSGALPAMMAAGALFISEIHGAPHEDHLASSLLPAG